MIESSCHCGNLKLKINSNVPDSLLLCNCSICRCYSALMAYFKEGEVSILLKEGTSCSRYVWGDKKLAFVRCSNCGCYSHWESLEDETPKQIGVNARLFRNIDLESIPVRRFDGAKSWKFLDD